MLLSMTGFGEAQCDDESLSVVVEVRAINGRHFKLGVRSIENISSFEPRIEAVVRRYIKRGTIQVQLRLERKSRGDAFVVNGEVLDGYRRQLEELCNTWHTPDPVRIDSLLALPGVIEDHQRDQIDVEKDWPPIEKALTASLESVNRMRREEGSATAEDLKENCGTIAERLDQIEARAPLVADGYRARLVERVRQSLGELNVKVDPTDLLREVSLFAERSDISEEIVRLRSHLEQFDDTMHLEESSGRKLDFLSQEMGREANTIGSKSNDVEISRHVIDVKTAIERIREQVQNIE